MVVYQILSEFTIFHTLKDFHIHYKIRQTSIKSLNESRFIQGFLFFKTLILSLWAIFSTFAVR